MDLMGDLANRHTFSSRVWTRIIKIRKDLLMVNIDLPSLLNERLEMVGKQAFGMTIG